MQLTEGRGADSGDRGGIGSRHRGAGDALSRVRAPHPAVRANIRNRSASRFPARTICVGERTLFGCYSASVDLQKESAELVFSGALPVEELISHRFPLD